MVERICNRKTCRTTVQRINAVWNNNPFWSSGPWLGATATSSVKSVIVAASIAAIVWGGRGASFVMPNLWSSTEFETGRKMLKQVYSYDLAQSMTASWDFNSNQVSVVHALRQYMELYTVTRTLYHNSNCTNTHGKHYVINGPRKNCAITGYSFANLSQTLPRVTETVEPVSINVKNGYPSMVTSIRFVRSRCGGLSFSDRFAVLPPLTAGVNFLSEASGVVVPRILEKQICSGGIRVRRPLSWESQLCNRFRLRD